MGVRKQFSNKRIMFIIIGVILGGVSGFLYWKYVGCVTGNCAITSVWYKSTLYGMLMGCMILDLIKENLK